MGNRDTLPKGRDPGKIDGTGSENVLQMGLGQTNIATTPETDSRWESLLWLPSLFRLESPIFCLAVAVKPLRQIDTLIYAKFMLTLGKR